MYVFPLWSMVIIDCLGLDFRGKFNAIQRTYSPIPRKFYGYCTSVTVRLIFQLFVLPINRGLAGNYDNGWYPCERYALTYSQIPFH